MGALVSVFLLESGDERAHVIALRRGVDGELAFLLRALDELLHPVGRRIGSHVGGRGTRLHLCRGGHRECQPCGDQETASLHASSPKKTGALAPAESAFTSRRPSSRGAGLPASE